MPLFFLRFDVFYPWSLLTYISLNIYWEIITFCSFWLQKSPFSHDTCISHPNKYSLFIFLKNSFIHKTLSHKQQTLDHTPVWVFTVHNNLKWWFKCCTTHLLNPCPPVCLEPSEWWYPDRWEAPPTPCNPCSQHWLDPQKWSHDWLDHLLSWHHHAVVSLQLWL